MNAHTYIEKKLVELEQLIMMGRKAEATFFYNESLATLEAESANEIEITYFTEKLEELFDTYSFI